MHKKSILFPFLFCGALFLGVQRLPAPLRSTMGGMPASGIPDPLDSARDDLLAQKIRTMQRSLTAVLSTDAEGKHLTVDFTPKDKQIFLVWQERNGFKGDQIRVSWVAEAVDGIPKGRSLGEEAETLPDAGAARSSFLLNPAKTNLPAGTYRAKLYKNTTLVRILKFSVKR